MRCLSCNEVLTDREATRRVLSTGEFLDLCDRCYEPIKEDVKTNERIETSEEFFESFEGPF